MAKKQGRDNSPTSGASADGPKESLLDAQARDSGVLTLIAKRIRAAKKKLKRADEIEALKASGREINSDQEEALRSKSKTLATIEELERLFPLLREAVTEEVGQKILAKTQQIEEEAAAASAEKAAEEAKASAEKHEAEAAKSAALVEDLTAQLQQAEARAKDIEAKLAEEKAANDSKLQEVQSAERTSVEEAITRLLQLIYFSKLFSNDSRDDNAYIHQIERDACLTYDSTVNFEGESLTAPDLDAICAFGKLVSTRPLTEIISHQTALERCKALALDWVHGTETPVPQLNTTVNELVVKFERIVGSGYYSIKPEIKDAHEVVAPTGFRAEPREAELGDGFVPVPAFPGGNPPPASNNNALQQLLYQRPNLPTAEVPAGGEHSLPNGFVPSISAGFIPSISGGFVPTSFPAAGQPPGFEPLLADKRAPSDASGTVPHFFGAGFQNPSFGVVNRPEAAPQPGAKPVLPPSNGNSINFMAPEPAPAPAAVAESSPAPPAAQPASEAEEQISERKAPYAGPPPARPRAQPVDAPPRGRGPGRGRGPPPARGEYGPRGTGRRGPPQGRGYRGRGGRDFQPPYGQQPLPQAGAY